MKVLLINNRHFHGGGADMVYFSTGELLEQAGNEVTFFSRHSAQAEPYKKDYYFAPDSEQYSSIRQAILYFNNSEAASALENLLEKEHFDIAHIHLLWGGLTASIINVLHRHNIPVVHTAHDYRMVCPAYLLKDGKGLFCERCKGGKFYHCTAHKCSNGRAVESLLMTAEMYYRNYKWRPTKSLDGVIFVSNFSKRKHIEFDHRFLHANTTVLYNCPEKRVAESLDLSLDTFDSYYLYYGRLSEEKGIPTLIHAFEHYPHLCLRIVGTGPLEDRLKSYCEEKQLKNIIFLGYKTGKELFDLVAKAKYVCVPSECYENNPMTIVEAYSLATPVIGAAIGGISEIVIDGKTGYTFESGSIDSLLLAVEKSKEIDRQEYSLQKNDAFEFGKTHFSRERHLESLVGFYKEVISKFNHN